MMRGADDVVLDLEIAEQKFDGEVVVRLDSANLGRGKNDNVRLFLGEEILDRLLAREVESGAIASYQIGKTVRLKPAHQARFRRSRDGLR